MPYMDNEKIVIDDVLDRQNYIKTIKTNSEKMRGENKAFKENKGNNQKHEQIYLATWNVSSTFNSGTRNKTIRKPYIKVGEYIFFNSVTDDRMFGTGFLVKNNLKTDVIEFTPVTNRICKIRIRSKYRKISIINVHCLTEDKEEEEKEEFYEHIEQIYNKIPRYDIKILIGDFNAKIGKETIYKPTIGGHSKHSKSNGNVGKNLWNLQQKRT
ncbi:unnamed protein product [Psylliodes chrysocephalus]|uniref:Craniofacial development protein 2 n=1 Tax=Psylliodes chrysocephalus TaxID=3402493 RepID=A0A9P0CYH9_9CUCU|nr:unnamed protein product [Psylliodes chrysocephala]